MRQIKTLVLRGSKYDMGVQYGTQLKEELKASLKILVDFFITKHSVPYEILIDAAEKFYDRYTGEFRMFLDGIGKGAGLALDDVKILNGMETLRSVIDQENTMSGCSFFAIPKSQSASENLLIGRNYDFFEPFGKIAQYLTLTVLHEPGKIPTAIIGLPCQIYRPSCINKNSLFFELNNGMASGGNAINPDSKSMLINLLEIMQVSSNLTIADSLLQKSKSDYSLIINIADNTTALSYEYSSFKGEKTYTPSANVVYVSTNFYLNDSWSAPSMPLTNINTGLSFLRSANLHERFKNTLEGSVDLKDVKEALDAWCLPSFGSFFGGAYMPFYKLLGGGTIYQIAYDTGSKNLCLKRSSYDDEWYCQDLDPLFSDQNQCLPYQYFNFNEL